jgi:hypothetical protein
MENYWTGGVPSWNGKFSRDEGELSNGNIMLRRVAIVELNF